MSPNILTIGYLAKKTGTKVETIRFYEKNGLRPQTGRNRGAYDHMHLNRLSLIRRARDLGFSLDQVRGLLRLSDDRDQSCKAVDEIANEHRAEVERKIRDLQALKAELDNIIDQCSCGTVADCRIIESLSPKH